MSEPVPIAMVSKMKIKILKFRAEEDYEIVTRDETYAARLEQS